MTTILDNQLRRMALAAATVLAVVHAAPAQADDVGSATRVPLLPTYRQECAACHLAYPPGMLPAASWLRLMSNLPRHFGTDASLDTATANDIADWLRTHAASGRRAQRDGAAPPVDRITRSAWFVREHRDVSATAWARPSVKSPSNCAACHTRADQGDFSEHQVRIPR